MIGEIAAFVRRNGLRAVFVHLLETYIGALLRWLPGPEGLILRGLFYRMLFSRAGADLLIYPQTYIMFSHRIAAGKRVAINRGCYIDAGGEVEIGDHVMFGPNVVISTRDHGTDPDAGPMCFQPVQFGKITIGNNVWLGANSFIRRGVTIGDNSIVAAGCVVIGDVPPNCVFGGVPGRVLKAR